MRAETRALLVGLLTLCLAGCGDASQLPEQSAVGANPNLPEPHSTLIPTVNIAPAKGWPAGGKPTAASGFAVNTAA
jgi:hypothetical protein